MFYSSLSKMTIPEQLPSKLNMIIFGDNCSANKLNVSIPLTDFDKIAPKNDENK